MLIVPCVIATLLAGGATPPASSPVAAPARLFDRLTFSTDQQTSSSASNAPSDQHLIGFGFLTGGLGLSTGLNVRYWFLKFVGADFRVYVKGADTGLVGSGGFSWELAPSLIVMLAKADPTKPVTFRPYLGVGVNHTHAGVNLTNGVSASGSGEQIFGGVEIQLQAVRGLAVSIEVDYNKRSSSLQAAGVTNGTSGEVGFLFYAK